MTELSFLIELLMNHKIPKITKELVVKRIREVEDYLLATNPMKPSQPMTQINRNIPVAGPPIENIAQTAAAASALQHRQDLINKSIAGKLTTLADGSRQKW